MSRLKAVLLAATLLAAGAGGVAWAQREPAYDPAQLPEVKGTVAQYALTPRGDVDGLILADGTEVHVPPFLSTELVFAVRPGDAVTIHGLKARALPMVAAASVTNDATHVTVTSVGPRMDNPIEAQGRIKEQLHSPRGDLNGVLLEDGTIIRLPPPEATKLASQLAVGQTLYARGAGVENPLGRLILARAIGPDRDQVTTIAAPPPPGPGWEHWGHGPHGMMGGDGRGEHGPFGMMGHNEPGEHGPFGMMGDDGPGEHGPSVPPPPSPPAQP
jgi:hypothetical protein